MRIGLMHRKRGFTLVETVVSVGILAALAAVVYPAVVKQFDTADPTRAAEDLGNIATAIEVFGVNVRPQQPQEIEDLVNLIQAATANDSTALGAAYTTSDVSNWNGPYLGLSIPPTTARNAVIVATGFGGTVNNRLPQYDVDVGVVGGDSVPTSSTAGDFVSVLVLALSGAAFNAINELIDGTTESTAVQKRHLGRFRCPGVAVPLDTDVCGAAYYLASPLRR